MDTDELKERTLAFGVRIVKMAGALPTDTAAKIISHQLIKSGTSIGANYREALHASSPRHFITTMEIAQREANETAYWIELIIRTELLPESRVKAMLDECQQLYAILTATILTRKDNLRKDDTDK